MLSRRTNKATSKGEGIFCVKSAHALISVKVIGAAPQTSCAQSTK